MNFITTNFLTFKLLLQRKVLGPLQRLTNWLMLDLPTPYTSSIYSQGFNYRFVKDLDETFIYKLAYIKAIFKPRNLIRILFMSIAFIYLWNINPLRTIAIFIIALYVYKYRTNKLNMPFGFQPITMTPGLLVLLVILPASVLVDTAISSPKHLFIFGGLASTALYGSSKLLGFTPLNMAYGVFSGSLGIAFTPFKWVGNKIADYFSVLKNVKESNLLLKEVKPVVETNQILIQEGNNVQEGFIEGMETVVDRQATSQVISLEQGNLIMEQNGVLLNQVSELKGTVHTIAQAMIGSTQSVINLNVEGDFIQTEPTQSSNSPIMRAEEDTILALNERRLAIEAKANETIADIKDKPLSQDIAIPVQNAKNKTPEINSNLSMTSSSSAQNNLFKNTIIGVGAAIATGVVSGYGGLGLYGVDAGLITGATVITGAFAYEGIKATGVSLPEIPNPLKHLDVTTATPSALEAKNKAFTLTTKTPAPVNVENSLSYTHNAYPIIEKPYVLHEDNNLADITSAITLNDIQLDQSSSAQLRRKYQLAKALGMAMHRGNNLDYLWQHPASIFNRSDDELEQGYEVMAEIFKDHSVNNSVFDEIRSNLELIEKAVVVIKNETSVSQIPDLSREDLISLALQYRNKLE